MRYVRRGHKGVRFEGGEGMAKKIPGAKGGDRRVT